MCRSLDTFALWLAWILDTPLIHALLAQFVILDDDKVLIRDQQITKDLLNCILSKVRLAHAWNANREDHYDLTLLFQHWCWNGLWGAFGSRLGLSCFLCWGTLFV